MHMTMFLALAGITLEQVDHWTIWDDHGNINVARPASQRLPTICISVILYLKDGSKRHFIVPYREPILLKDSE